jgi:hypothetical protein
MNEQVSAGQKARMEETTKIPHNKAQLTFLAPFNSAVTSCVLPGYEAEEWFECFGCVAVEHPRTSVWSRERMEIQVAAMKISRLRARCSISSRENENAGICILEYPKIHRL